MPRALKALAGLPRKDALSLVAKLKAVAAEPFGAHSAAKRLTSQDGYRLRHGDWRALYRIDRADNVVVVDDIAHRREAYR